MFVRKCRLRSFYGLWMSGRGVWWDCNLESVCAEMQAAVILWIVDEWTWSLVGLQFRECDRSSLITVCPNSTVSTTNPVRNTWD